MLYNNTVVSRNKKHKTFVSVKIIMVIAEIVLCVLCIERNEEFDEPEMNGKAIGSVPSSSAGTGPNGL